MFYIFTYIRLYHGNHIKVSERFDLAYFLFNVTFNDNSVIYEMANRWEGWLREEVGPMIGLPCHGHFVGFFYVPVPAPTRSQHFYNCSEKPPHFSRLFNDAWGYGGPILVLNPRGLPWVRIERKKVTNKLQFTETPYKFPTQILTLMVCTRFGWLIYLSMYVCYNYNLSSFFILVYLSLLKAWLLRYKRLQLPKICRGTQIVIEWTLTIPVPH